MDNLGPMQRQLRDQVLCVASGRTCCSWQGGPLLNGGDGGGGGLLLLLLLLLLLRGTHITKIR